MHDPAILWNQLHASPRFRPNYPSEHVVRFLLGARDLLTDRPSALFLDIGTGAGRHLALAAEVGFFPIGMDLSRTGLAHAHERMVARGAPHELVSGAMGNLPFADGTFSVVLSYGVFCYGTANEMNNAIHEAWRVMRGGAKLFVVLRSTRDYRCGKGQELEPNTFRLDIADTNELGTVQHFLGEDRIPVYFERFRKLTFESSEVSFANRSRLDSDWLITAEK